MDDLILLKLGGSLITDKLRAHTPRRDVLARLAAEIQAALQANPHLRLVIGHGSGSFGHTPAKQHGTRQGVSTLPQWLGFVEVWKEARALNQIVLEALSSAGLPVMALPPSASVLAADGKLEQWPLAPLQSALEHGLIPLINGDVIFDRVRGGTILSTEDLFLHLARSLRPGRILLAGLEDGVLEDYPACTRLVESITAQNFAQILPHLGQSAGVDVTGGMAEKVRSMVELVEELPGCKALIFSGQHPGLVRQALLGSLPGTVITR
jgi:isopentenyl phosphate kinase